ncbi:MAG: class II aldolase/adducin family protein [candidate division Zixibacteria bacterium]
MSETEKIASEITDFGKRLYERNYICATEGNLSARLSDGRIMITPSGANKGYLKQSDIVICDIDGNVLEGEREPSSEIKLHLAAYKHRPDIIAVCHAHPVYATAFAVAGRALSKSVLPEIVSTLGAVPLVEYAPPGSARIAENLRSSLDRYDAFLLRSHGVVTLGKSCEEAFNRMESVERFANILFLAERAGGAGLLSEKETIHLLELAKREDILSEIEFGG